MAHFTAAQASSSKLESVRKEIIDGSFGYWVLRVSGSDGEYKQFVDHDLAANASISDVKDRLYGHLTSSEYYVEPTPPVVSGSNEFGDSIGDTLK